MSSCNRARLRSLLSGVEQFHVKNQRRIGRDGPASSARAIAEIRGNSQLPLSSDLHPRDSFIPALDHLSTPQRKRKRFATIARAVELLTRSQPAGVVDADGISGNCRRAGAGCNVPVLKAGSGGRRLSAHFCRTGAAECATLFAAAASACRCQALANTNSKSKFVERNLKKVLIKLSWYLSLSHGDCTASVL